MKPPAERSRKLVSQAEFHSLAVNRRAGNVAVYRLATDPAFEVPGEARTMRFCFSDGSVDRMGDAINPNGWDLRDFNANPVALWSHSSSEPPIGRASNIAVENARLMGDIEFAPPEIYEFADLVYRLLRDGFLRAVSVGFIPIEYSFANTPDRPWGIDFKRQTLLEISVCPVPANPNALAAARSVEIDTRPLAKWAGRRLDGGGVATVARSQLTRLASWAREPPTNRSKERDLQRALELRGRDRIASDLARVAHIRANDATATDLATAARLRAKTSAAIMP
jgi:HK97 family phage prohead protease